MHNSSRNHRGLAATAWRLQQFRCDPCISQLRLRPAASALRPAAARTASMRTRLALAFASSSCEPALNVAWYSLSSCDTTSSLVVGSSILAGGGGTLLLQVWLAHVCLLVWDACYLLAAGCAPAAVGTRLRVHEAGSLQHIVTLRRLTRHTTLHTRRKELQHARPRMRWPQQHPGCPRTSHSTPTPQAAGSLTDSLGSSTAAARPHNTLHAQHGKTPCGPACSAGPARRCSQG